MARGRHRTAPDRRRPLPQPVVGAVIASTILGASLLVGALPPGTPAPDASVAPGPSDDVRAEASLSPLDRTRELARDQARASRGLERPPLPSAEPSAAPPTPEPSASAEPSTEPEATAEPTPAEPPAVVGQLWVTQDVNVRSGPSAGTERVGYLGALDQVDVTGESADGWTQVVVDGRAGWVNGSYLSESEPEPEPEPEPEAQADSGSSDSESDSESSDSGSAATSDASCSVNPGIEPNLSSNARAVYRAVCAAYGGSVSGFGGYRPGDGGDHGSGRAVDIMVSGELGWDISRFLQSRAGELGITYVIYEQQIWMAGSPAGAWEYMEDRGGATANHFDHVHVSVS